MRALAARRAGDMLRDALMVGLSVTRRAGIVINFFTLFYSFVPDFTNLYLSN